MKTITYNDNDYALIPLSAFPFSGDFICVEDKTEVVLWDSRIDGYDLIVDDSDLIAWVELVKDNSVPEGAIYKFTMVNKAEKKGEK